MNQTGPDPEATRSVNPAFSTEDGEIELTLRPKLLDEYIGQHKAKENLKVFIAAALNRKEALDHCLFYGPPGVGKTTLANVVANELGVNLRVTSGPAIERPGDLASLLTNIGEKDVLFVDEIHRMPRSIEEILYPAMEDFGLDIIIGKGPSARAVRLELPHFTLIGATTRAGKLSPPLRDRFGILLRLELYDHTSLAKIVERSSHILKADCDAGGAQEIAARSRGTPRIANRLLRRVRDFAEFYYEKKITKETAELVLQKLDIDKLGLDLLDHRMMNTIIKNYNGGPVGLETLATAIGEEAVTLEDVYEPYLIQIGFLARTPRGRCATSLCYEYLGKKSQQPNLFPHPNNQKPD
ncbi:MAG: Holliday junction branch migration DNA helicase RuvB [Oscillospiraceae bacterium]|nr:Holliday junction branch migration DNA helicase RuvB [Oscillospiraceae bacterium]